MLYFQSKTKQDDYLSTSMFDVIVCLKQFQKKSEHLSYQIKAIRSAWKLCDVF